EISRWKDVLARRERDVEDAERRLVRLKAEAARIEDGLEEGRGGRRAREETERELGEALAGAEEAGLALRLARAERDGARDRIDELEERNWAVLSEKQPRHEPSKTCTHVVRGEEWVSPLCQREVEEHDDETRGRHKVQPSRPRQHGVPNDAAEDDNDEPREGNAGPHAQPRSHETHLHVDRGLDLAGARHLELGEDLDVE
ncbi:hypothetical protein THAOC_12484, partial [Thalassiosira oceanica]